MALLIDSSIFIALERRGETPVSLLDRFGDPEHDIGRVAVFLASPDSSYITGNTLVVDGGTHYLG